MASVGPYDPGTVVDDSAVGTETWYTPQYAKYNDGDYAGSSASSSTKYTHYLKATNFGFSIPSGATIDGIKVEIYKKRAALDTIYDNEVKLVVGGSVTGSNYAATSTKWPSSFTYSSYGGSSDKWGLTPTVSQINGSDFGVVLQVKLVPAGKVMAQAYVDHIRITVYYTEGSSADELTAQAITCGTPTIGKPTIAEKHALTSKTIEVGVPTLEQPTIGQKHALTSKAITAGIPTIAKPNIGQKHALTSKAITVGTPLVEKPAIGQIHALTSQGIVSGAPVIEKPQPGAEAVTVNLTAKDIICGVPVIGKATIGAGAEPEEGHATVYQELFEPRIREEDEELILLAIMELL